MQANRRENSREREERCHMGIANIIRRWAHEASQSGQSPGSLPPSTSDRGRVASRGAQTAIRSAWPNGHGLRRGEGKFGLRKDVERRLAWPRRQFAIFTKPARQEGLGSFFNPLLEQCGDFLAQIGGVIQTGELEAFERRVRCFVQIIPRRHDTAGGHDLEPPRTPMAATINTTHNSAPDISNVFTLGPVEMSKRKTVCQRRRLDRV